MRKILITIIMLCAAAFAWWTISPLFIDKIVEDELPTNIQTLLEQESENEATLTPPEEQPVAIEPTVTAQPTVQGPYIIEDTPGHRASGAVRILSTPDEKSIVRYENYNGTNGPDLYVYLAKDLDATEFISLGQAKGNVGNINYTVPNDVDLNEYSYVMTWCKAFGVLFDYAEIN